MPVHSTTTRATPAAYPRPVVAARRYVYQPLGGYTPVNNNSVSPWQMSFSGGAMFGAYWGYPLFFNSFACDPLLFGYCDPFALFDMGLPLFPGFGLDPFDFNMAIENPLLFDTMLENEYLLSAWGMGYGPSIYSSMAPGASINLFGPFAPSSVGTTWATQVVPASSFYAAAESGAPSATVASPTAAAWSGTGTVIEAGNPAAGQPVTLVFTDGTTAQATEYRLSGGQLEYKTTAGVSASIPLSKLNMSATMTANERNGVRFLAPAAAAAAPQQQP